MHHFQSLGGWTFAFDDYWLQNITSTLPDPINEEFAKHVDPYSKYIINFL